MKSNSSSRLRRLSTRQILLTGVLAYGVCALLFYFFLVLYSRHLDSQEEAVPANTTIISAAAMLAAPTATKVAAAAQQDSSYAPTWKGPSPTAVVGLRWQDITSGYAKQTTDLQRSEFLRQFNGKHVHWNMYVANVNGSGTVYVRELQWW